MMSTSVMTVMYLDSIRARPRGRGENEDLGGLGAAAPAPIGQQLGHAHGGASQRERVGGPAVDLRLPVSLAAKQLAPWGPAADSDQEASAGMDATANRVSAFLSLLWMGRMQGCGPACLPAFRKCNELSPGITL